MAKFINDFTWITESELQIAEAIFYTDRPLTVEEAAWLAWGGRDCGLEPEMLEIMIKDSDANVAVFDLAEVAEKALEALCIVGGACHPSPLFL